MYAQQRHAHWNYFLQPSSLSCFLTCLVRDSCNRQQLQPITRTAKYVWRCSNDARAYAIEYVHVPADLTADSRTSACTQTHLCATHLSTAIPAHTLKSSGLVFFLLFLLIYAQISGLVICAVATHNLSHLLPLYLHLLKTTGHRVYTREVVTGTRTWTKVRGAST